MQSLGDVLRVSSVCTEFCCSRDANHSIYVKERCYEPSSPSDIELKAFKALKESLTSPPVLTLPDPDLPYSVGSDASTTKIGAALFHEFEVDGVCHPIEFWTRALSETERNYSATERECLGVIRAVQVLRP